MEWSYKSLEQFVGNVIRNLKEVVQANLQMISYFKKPSEGAQMQQ